MPERRFFVSPAELTPNKPKQIERVIIPDPERRWIIQAMKAAYDSQLTAEDPNLGENVVPVGNGRKSNEFAPVNHTELNELILNFRADPILAQALMRVKFIELLREENKSWSDTSELLSVYLAAYFDLIVKLDRSAFPPSDRETLFEGMPEYLPDGFSDLDFDRKIDEQKRTFEKMRVDKSLFYLKIFQDIKGILINSASQLFPVNSYGIKMYLAKSIMNFTNTTLPYDYQKYAVRDGGKSVLFHTYRDAQEAVSVCRQHAIDTQLGFQILGIRSGLFKSLTRDLHVNNILIGQDQWNIADSTNPEIDPMSGQIRPFIAQIEPATEQDQQWAVTRITTNKSGRLVYESVTYALRRPTYYRILDNRENPVV